MMAFDFKQVFVYKKNIGTEEQKKRYALGAGAVLISIFTHSVPLLLLGCVLLGTAKANFCPLWSGLGKSTCGNSEIKAG
jgi:Protein of unknown function (DUF2892)